MGAAAARWGAAADRLPLPSAADDASIAAEAAAAKASSQADGDGDDDDAME
jgi:hypothetical protein